MRSILLLLASFPAWSAAPQTVIVDAEDFYHAMPRGDLMGDALSLRVPWLHRNTAVVLRSKADAVAKIHVPATGEYHLFVRSQGAADGSSFRIVVGGKSDAGTYGDGAMQWKRGASYKLAAGALEVKLTGITPAPALDAIVLTQNTDFREEDLKSYELPEDVALLKEYRTPRPAAVKFGDVNGDGKTDLFVIEPNWSAHVFDNGGKELWSYTAPVEETRLRAEFEPPGIVWDFDQDGKAEVAHWRLIDNREWLVIADGQTGVIKHRVEWPTIPRPHVYNNFRLAVGRMQKGYPSNLIVFTDSGGTISMTAYTKELKQLWQHVEHKKKDHLGHYIYPVDLDGDGIDEVVVSHLALNAKGETLWNRFDVFADNHDHADNMQFTDLDGDGKLEILAGVSDIGVVVSRALTGEILWHNMAAHSQQINFTRILSGKPGPQVAVNGRIYGDRRRGEPGLAAQVHWFDPGGNLLSIWPASPLNGNPDFVKGDWRGDGTEALFWFKFRLGSDGRGTVYFQEPVYHMFDFMGRGAEEVIATQGGVIRVYGAKSVKEKALVRDAEYKRLRMANHTHY
ncbi:MAG: VCBS repeat-containing protein [Candidatus Solibacter usitatus]|nr:VCBS repeat-containing protein [Candidatus Solibacter usitatus]